ncbi:hypothetical protein SAMN05444166_2732 [Singulisphaera sp. GP187]|uniref:hypothetical protein n=1 Tax=Singulisphaera sp. GP187 TaxID=1882752 RepID=UPI00092873AB|nr:hypothetical protein [Singulisphaera sp. GP187]SIO15439.1 hypothetical protein SAMN05444166_2732 [Singulisphaera sp. GP187]
MPWYDPRFAALVLGLLVMGPAGSAADLPRAAVVIAPELDVFDEPDDRSVASGQLQQGDRVVVRAVDNDGWLTIEPPPGSFLWIEQSAIDPPVGLGVAKVDVSQTQVRSGIPDAKLPGPPHGSLSRDQKVRLIDRPPLTFGKKTWRAIAPLARDVRHIRAEGVEWDSATKNAAEPAQETQAGFAAVGSLPDPPPEIAAEIARIELSHRAILRDSIEHWRLDSIRLRYEALLKRATDSASNQAIQARLDLVARHEAAAESARKFEAILEKSRNRDRKIALYLRRLARAEEPQQRPYDAKGMIQPSSHKVDGQKVFALIGPKGTAIAYLNIPAGLDPSRLTARNVGVRGSVHYNESLRAQLITVRDLEPLDGIQRK